MRGGIFPLDNISHPCYNINVMSKIIRDTGFKIVAHSVKPDAKSRVGLLKARVPANVTYDIYCNDMGQIVLDPQVTIPASELWLFQNKKALASVQQGLIESSSGKAESRGSFSRFVKDAP
jgi:hypothetical protein